MANIQLPPTEQLVSTAIPGAASTAMSGGLAGVAGGLPAWLGSALVGLGGGLFKGIFGGMGKKQEDKRKWDLFMKRMGMLKPKGEYSRGIDPVVQAALANMFTSRGMPNPYAGTEQTPPGARKYSPVKEEEPRRV